MCTSSLFRMKSSLLYKFKQETAYIEKKTPLSRAHQSPSWLSLFSLRLYRSNECSQLQLSHTNTKAPFWEKISTITIKREPLYCGQGALNSYTRRVYLYIYWILHTHKLSIWTPSFLLSGKWINIWIIWADRDFFQGRDGTCILLIQSICRLKPHFIACFWFSKMTF